MFTMSKMSTLHIINSFNPTTIRGILLVSPFYSKKLRARLVNQVYTASECTFHHGIFYLILFNIILLDIL